MSHTDTVVTLGIDVSKAYLDTHLSPAGRHARHANNCEGIAGLLAGLPEGLSHIVLEPSGGYEQPVFSALQQAGLPVSLVNARRIRDYARARGILAKTDKLDAAVLADYAATIRPVPTPVATPLQNRLQRFVRRREHIVTAIKREKNALEHLHEPDLIAMVHNHIRFLQTQLGCISKTIARIIANDDAIARKHAIMQSCKGIGPAVAATLLADFPELGIIDGRKAAAMAGLAPLNRDSGSWRGQRRIGSGRASVRRALYMAALSASRHNPDIKDFYQKKKCQGKTPKQALIACARKLLLTINALIRDNRVWQP